MAQALRTSNTVATDSGQLAPSERPVRHLRLLSYNVQTGISTQHYRHYLTQSWKHVLPYPQRFENLDRIARLIRGYDVVGLQELDNGSLRSGFVNLTQYLSERAGYPIWYDQTNRRVGKFARHATGMLSRLQPSAIKEHKLPGRIPGRGVLSIQFGTSGEPLHLLIVHLALGQRARLRQLAYICDLMQEHKHVVLMGDLNCRSQSPEMDYLLANTTVREPVHGLNTFPSWRPQHNIDHILVSRSLNIETANVLHYPFSDHLPVAMEISLPETVQLFATH